MLSLGFALRLIQHPFACDLCIAAGAVSALSIWTSVESLVIVAVILSVLGGLWIRDGGDGVKKVLCYSASLFLFTCLALVIERPWHDLATVEFDRLSIVHSVLFGLITALLLALFVLATRTGLLRQWLVRLGASLAAMAILTLMTEAAFPGFYRGPLADVGPEMARVLLQTEELQPLLSVGLFWDFGVPLIGYGLVFLGVLFCRKIDLKDRRWILILVASVVFTGLSFHQARWAMYGEVLLLLPVVALIVHLRNGLNNSQRSLWRLLANLGITGVFILLAVSGSLIAHFTEKAEQPTVHSRSSLRTLCHHLATDAHWRGRKLRILAEINYGGEILYRTPHEVIATVYHRNHQGLTDACAIMAAQTDEEAQRRIRDRGIDMILLSPGQDNWLQSAPSGETSTLYHRLCDSEFPAWCQPVDLPPDLSDFQLFEICVE